jgi:hypothetical protein
MFAQPQKKVLIKTRTGEAYQPCRIYYQVFNQKTVTGAFKKLRCMEWEPTMNPWRWRYDQEARKLRFDVSWNQIPKEHRPVILADFFFRSDTEMLVDVRSFQRVIQVLQFFDKHINRRAARATRLRIVNKYLNINDQLGEEQLHPPFDYFFDREDIEIPDPEGFEQELLEQVPTDADESTRIQALTEFLEEKSKQPLPEIEEIPLHFYEDGIAPLEMTLTMRGVEAMEHWNGNRSFSQHDLITQMVEIFKNLPLDDLDEDSEDPVEAEEGDTSALADKSSLPAE